MRPPHDDPAIEKVLTRLASFCKWRVRFSDSQYLCECSRHNFLFRIGTLSQQTHTAGEIKELLTERFHCIGDWSS